MENSDDKQLKGIMILLLTALIWGTTFVSQSIGCQTVDTFTFMTVRTILGSVVLVPIVMARRKKGLTKERSLRKVAHAGLVLGIVLAIASNSQQEAFKYSTAGKIAFITATYMLIVPIIKSFSGNRLTPLTWLSVALGIAGLYMLCLKGQDSLTLGKGEIWSLICSVFYAIQIIHIEKFLKDCDTIELAFAQFAVCGILSAVLMLVFEHPTYSGIRQSALPLLYSGIMSCGIAYTLQVVGQKYCKPTPASLAMCMESVFAVISSAIILSERMNVWEISGCCLMMAAVIMSAVNKAA